MWEVLASILMKNRKWIGSWRDHSVSDYHYYSSELHFIGLDVIKVTLLFSFRLFQSAYACSFLQNQMWIHNLRGRSISMSASVDGDKLLANTNRFESKPKCHLSFLFSNPWSGSHPSSFHGPIFCLIQKATSCIYVVLWFETWFLSGWDIEVERYITLILSEFSCRRG